jgi:hypothetical protein
MGKVRYVLPALALGFVFASAEFGPNLRIDHENRTTNGCFNAAITAGPAICVAFEDDSMQGVVTVRSDIRFQKSTDGGASFLPQDVIVRRGQVFACYPDICYDRFGNLYVVYTERDAAGTNGHVYSTRSTDQGATWSSPSRIDDNANGVAVGWGRVAADSAGNLFCAWNDQRLTYLHIWSSVSTDQGTTWETNVRVDADTVSSDCYQTDVAVQPGTNQYLVAATNPYYVRPQNISSHGVLSRSLDRGQTFLPAVVLDTFSYYCGQPHVIADQGYIVTDFTGSSSGSSNQNLTEARTSSDSGQTWSSPAPVTDLDTLYQSYYNGAKLSLDGSGAVHTALMVCDLVNYNYNIYHSFSTDHGLSWSQREQVNDVHSAIEADPDIAADSSGSAYVTWQDGRDSRNEIWFATNRLAGVSEQDRPGKSAGIRLPGIARGTLLLPGKSPALLLDITGRRVGELVPGLNDLHRFAPGVYFVQQETAHKLVITR